MREEKFSRCRAH